MANQKLYVFWNYEQPPYMLGAVIERFNDDGTITPEGYNGATVTPVIVLPEERGAAALEDLERLGAQFGADSSALREQYRKVAVAIVVDGARLKT